MINNLYIHSMEEYFAEIALLTTMPSETNMLEVATRQGESMQIYSLLKKQGEECQCPIVSWSDF